MGKFTSSQNHAVALKTFQLPKGETLRLHLVDVKARIAGDITLKCKGNISASVKSSPYDGPKGIWVVNVTGVTEGSVTLEAIHKEKSVASIEVNVFKKIDLSLPNETTQEGLLARLFVCEATSRGKVGIYNADDVKTSLY